MIPPLETAEKTYLTVDHDELDRFIEQHFGQPYSVVSALEATNGTHFTITVNPDRHNPAARSVTEWLDGSSGQPRLGVVLNHLAAHHAIPAGDYLVRVSW